MTARLTADLFQSWIYIFRRRGGLPMFYQLCALAMTCLVLGIAAVRRCSPYSPIVINAFIWLVTFIVGLIFDKRFYPLQEKAFIAWTIWFMVTSLIFFLLSPSNLKSSWNDSEKRRIPVDYSLLLILLLLWLIYKIWIVGSGGPEHFFINLRWSSLGVEGFIPYGIISRFYPLVFSLFLFEHVYACQENRRLRFLLWIYMLLAAVATMSKIQILTPVLSWLIIQGVKGRVNVGRIIVLIAVAFLLMIPLHFVRGEGSYVTSIDDIIALYIYSPLVAFEYMNVDSSMPFGAYVFRFFYAIGNILGIAPEPVVLILPYLNVPILTNVYTIMHPFYHDFGMLGVLLQASIYGFFFGFLYLFSVKKGGLWLILFSGYSIVLVAQFIVDLLITLFSFNLQFLIYTLAIFWFSRRIYHDL